MGVWTADAAAGEVYGEHQVVESLRNESERKERLFGYFKFLVVKDLQQNFTGEVKYSHSQVTGLSKDGWRGTFDGKPIWKGNVSGCAVPPEVTGTRISTSVANCEQQPAGIRMQCIGHYTLKKIATSRAGDRLEVLAANQSQPVKGWTSLAVHEYYVYLDGVKKGLDMG